MPWPEEPEDGSQVVYRDYEINPSMFQCMGAMYSYVHMDYDGPEDNRHGTEATFEDCLRAIDEALDEG